MSKVRHEYRTYGGDNAACSQHDRTPLLRQVFTHLQGVRGGSSSLVNELSWVGEQADGP